MEDSTPLLTSQAKEPVESKRNPPSIDQVIEECIGELGFMQMVQAIVVSFAWVFDAQQTFISVFTDAEPHWHCTTSITTTCTNICMLPNDSWTWDRPIYASTISEWALQCETSLLKGLPASSFFLGCLVGGLLLATLADSPLGRKNMLFLSCLLMSFSSALTVFSTSVWVYSALKFIIGIGRSTISTTALVLSTELVGKKWRGQVGVFGFFCFTLGFLSLPAIAYINRDSSWRYLYMWTAIPTLFYCLLVRFFVCESPRWLLVRGRKEEAVAILKSIASAKKPHDLTIMSFLDVKVELERSNGDIYSAIKILIQKKWALRRLCGVMIIGLGVGFVYYGMPLSLGNLAFNFYLSVTLNALSELPSSLVTFFLINKLNRKGSMLSLAIISGICSVLCVVVAKTSTGLQIALELVSFFAACSTFNILLIYSTELFPTCVRNSAISMVRQALVFGGVLSPVLVAAAGKNEFMSFGVFGLVIGFCGLFAVSLPETKNKMLCDTMEEEERSLQFGQSQGPINAV